MHEQNVLRDGELDTIRRIVEGNNQGEVDKLLLKMTREALRDPDTLRVVINRHVDRHQDCPCGSGRRFKNCCLRNDNVVKWFAAGLTRKGAE